MSQPWAFVAGKQGTVFYHDMLCKGWGEEAGPGGAVLCWRGLRPSSKDLRAAGGDLAVLSPREGWVLETCSVLLPGCMVLGGSEAGFCTEAQRGRCHWEGLARPFLGAWMGYMILWGKQCDVCMFVYAHACAHGTHVRACLCVIQCLCVLICAHLCALLRVCVCECIWHKAGSNVGSRGALLA